MKMRKFKKHTLKNWKIYICTYIQLNSQTCDTLVSCYIIAQRKSRSVGGGGVGEHRTLHYVYVIIHVLAVSFFHLQHHPRVHITLCMNSVRIIVSNLYGYGFAFDSLIHIHLIQVYIDIRTVHTTQRRLLFHVCAFFFCCCFIVLCSVLFFVFPVVYEYKNSLKRWGVIWYLFCVWHLTTTITATQPSRSFILLTIWLGTCAHCTYTVFLFSTLFLFLFF